MAESNNDITQRHDYIGLEEGRVEGRLRHWMESNGYPREFAETCVERRHHIFRFDPPIPSNAAILANVQAVVAYSFDYGGKKAGFEDDDFTACYDRVIHKPGSANEQIAKVFRDLVHSSGAVGYAQEEAAVAAEDLGLYVPYHRRAVPSRDSYLGTRGVGIKCAEAGLWDPSIKTVGVVAHRDHIRRCVGATRRAIIEVRRRRKLNCPAPQIVVPATDSILYPTEGFQVWVSGGGLPGRGGPTDFRPHEATARIDALFNGWMEWSDLTSSQF